MKTKSLPLATIVVSLALGCFAVQPAQAQQPTFPDRPMISLRDFLPMWQRRFLASKWSSRIEREPTA